MKYKLQLLDPITAFTNWRSFHGDKRMLTKLHLEVTEVEVQRSAQFECKPGKLQLSVSVWCRCPFQGVQSGFDEKFPQ